MQNVLPLRRKRSGEPTEPVDLVTRDEALTPAAGAESARSFVNVEHVDLGPLAWLAVRCALIVTIIGAAGILLVWTLLDAGGEVSRFESFMRSIGFRDFHIAPTAVLLGLALIVTGVALALATFVVLAGAAYNLLAMSGSGIRLRIAAAPLAAEARREVATEPVPVTVIDDELPRASVGSRSGLVPEPIA